MRMIITNFRQQRFTFQLYFTTFPIYWRYFNLLPFYRFLFSIFAAFISQGQNYVFRFHWFSVHYIRNWNLSHGHHLVRTIWMWKFIFQPLRFCSVTAENTISLKAEHVQDIISFVRNIFLRASAFKIISRIKLYKISYKWEFFE